MQNLVPPILESMMQGQIWVRHDAIHRWPKWKRSMANRHQSELATKFRIHLNCCWAQQQSQSQLQMLAIYLNDLYTPGKRLLLLHSMNILNWLMSKIAYVLQLFEGNWRSQQLNFLQNLIIIIVIILVYSILFLSNCI